MYAKFKLMPTLFAALAVSGILDIAKSADLEIIKTDDGSGMLYELSLINRDNDVNIQSVEVNRGCDTPYMVRSPFTIKFGERLNMGSVRCDPIEVKIKTDVGEETFQWDAFTEAGVSVSIQAYISPLWKVYVTSRIEGLKIKKVAINRGNCQFGESVADHTSVINNNRLRFGGRLLFMASCNPIEVEVTTSEGVGTFSFE